LDYEIALARCQGSRAALDLLLNLSKVSACPTEAVLDVRNQYVQWHESAHHHLDLTAEQFPEFVSALQERLGRRLILFAEAETFREQSEYGTLPQSIAEDMQEEISERLRELRGADVARLKVEPEELLRKVSCFVEIPQEQFAALASRLRARTVAQNEVIIRQGEVGSSVFLIARGVVRVSREEGQATRDLTTLIAGDFFGEIALLRREPRTATVTAVTPCSLYELRREDLDVVIESFPSLRNALEEADRRRMGELAADLS
jgi:CPA1 family monovalent cation:H+ antiporter